MMEPLRLLLLGTPHIWHGDRPITINRRLQRSMLFYLACRPEGVSRAELADLFWGGEQHSEEETRRFLREHLSKLKKELPDPELLQVGMDRVRLDPDRLYVDVREFQSLVERNRRSLTETQRTGELSETASEQLRKAALLWNSPSFLGGVKLVSSLAFDRWQTDLSYALQSDRLHILERLGDHYISHNDFEQAYPWLRAVVESDPWNLQAQLRLLNCHISLQRYSEALTHVDHLAQLYKSEDEELPGQIKKLEQYIRERAAEPPPALQPVWPGSLVLAVGFVGRQATLQKLKRQFQRGGAGVILGEAGGGKTRLVHELYYNLQPLPRLLLTSAHLIDQGVPFAPLREMLRRSLMPDEFARLNEPWAGQLARLFPELAASRAQPADGAENRDVVLEAFYQLLQIMARQRRLLLFLDDAQWADEATLAVLEHLLNRGFFNRSGLLLLAARTEEINPHLEAFFNRINPSYPVERYELAGLQPADVTEMTCNLLGEVPSDTAVDNLIRDTAGNPLFLTETLRSLASYLPGEPLEERLESMPVPASLGAILHERRQMLRASSREVLFAAAVVQKEFTPQLLEEVTGLSGEQVMQALEDLERFHLILPQSNRVDELNYIFSHDRIRETVLLEVSLARRRLLHLRVARALERRPQGALHVQAAVLAWHYEQAGEYRAAFDLWLKAADQAALMFASAEAHSAFQNAEALLPRIEVNLEDQAIYHLYNAWGDLAYDTSDKARMQHAYTCLHQYGERRRSPLLLGSALSGLGLASLYNDRLQESLPYIQQALFYLKQVNDPYELAQATNRLSQACIFNLRYAEAAATLEEAHRYALAADAEHDPRLGKTLCDTHNRLAMVHTMTGWPNRGAEMSRQSLAESLNLFYSTGIIIAYYSLAMALFYSAHYEESLQQVALGLPMAEQRCNWRMTGYLHMIAARSELSLGHLDAAWQHALATRDVGDRFGFDELSSAGLGVQGDLWHLIECYPPALELYRQAVESTHNLYTHADNLARLGRLLIDMGQEEEGLRLLDEVDQKTRGTNLEILAIVNQINRTPSLIQRGEIDQVHRILEQYTDLEERGLGGMNTIFDVMRFRLALTQGKPAEALRAANRIIEIGDRVKNVLAQILGRQLAREACAQLGLAGDDYIRQLSAIAAALRDHTQLPEIRPALDDFCHKLLQ